MIQWRPLFLFALLGQKRYADAEPLLLAGYEGMRQREKMIPEQGKIRLLRAVERLVQLNEATGKKDEAARWRKELEAIKAVSNKAEEKPPIAPVSHEARSISRERPYSS